MKHVLEVAASVASSAGGAKEESTPKHGDPTALQPPGQGESVLGVRVGSEAAVESGTDPVLPSAGNLSEATRIRNKDILARDEKERKRRGLSATAKTVSMSFEGPMMVERLDDDERTPVKEMFSGSFTGAIPERGLLLRPLRKEEEAELLPNPERNSRRAEDLVKGSGAGGGGNPMAARDHRGVTSSPGASAGGQASVSPSGGGSTSRR